MWLATGNGVKASPGERYQKEKHRHILENRTEEYAKRTRVDYRAFPVDEWTGKILNPKFATGRNRKSFLTPEALPHLSALVYSVSNRADRERQRRSKSNKVRSRQS
jgi:hypothetical protein